MPQSGPRKTSDECRREAAVGARFLLFDATMTKSPVTRMLLMIFRSSLEAEVFELLRKLRVKAFSDVPRVLGVGEAGIALHSFPSPGFNCMILTALDERESERVIDGVRRFHDRIRKAQKNSAVPLRLFVLPCTQAI